MFCKYCGKEIDDDSTFCIFCGKAISSTPIKQTETESSGASPDSSTKAHNSSSKAQSSQNMRRCRRCGKPLETTEKEFCNSCRAQLQIWEEKASKKSFRKKVFITALVVAAIIIIPAMINELMPAFWFSPPPAVQSNSGSSNSYSEKKEIDSSSPSENDPLISYSEYLEIKEGMTYDDVCTIIGSYGKELSRVSMNGYETIMIMWSGEGSIGANANVTFQNGKVIAKSQIGLE